MYFKRVRGPVAFVAAMSFVFVPAAGAVAPPNDLRTAAQVLPDGPYPVLSTAVDVFDATTTDDPPGPSCATPVSRSVWYRFTPGTSSHYRLSTALDAGASSSLSNTVLAIYTSAGGSAGPFTELPTDPVADTDGCDDDSAINGIDQSTIHTRLTGGTEYWLVAWQFDTPPPMAGESEVQVKIDRNASPANDNVSGALDLQLNAPRSGNFVAAFNDYTLPGASPCFAGTGHLPSTSTGRDLVYRFTAPSAGDYSFRLAETSTGVFDTVLYTAGSLPAQSPTPQDAACVSAANRTAALFASEEMSPQTLTAGQVIFVVVDQTAASVDGSFRIVAERSTSESEPNGTPATASPTSCGMRGAMAPGGDIDFFGLGSPPAGSRIFALADAAATSDGDFEMRVTTAVDTLEYDDDDAVNRFGTLAPLIAGTTATGAPSFLRVNYDGAIVTEPYRLYTAIQPAATNATLEGPEPNGTPAQATPAPNFYARGSLLPDTDEDTFAVTLPARTLVFAGLDLDPTRDNTTWNGRLTLIGPAGNSLVDVNNVNTAASNLSGAGSLTSTTPHSPGEGLVFRTDEAGTYYVRVGTNPPSAFGDYLLSISAECTAGALPTETVDPKPNPGDTTAPETTIDKGAKKKSKRQRVIFEFSSSEPGSTFECVLDTAEPFLCTSPLRTKKLRPGRHKFWVRARDAAGNIDDTPASQSFKVKRKKR